MGQVNSYKDIVAWQHAHKLVLLTYKLTQTLPDTEKFNLISQMRRAVVSVTSNIVEGHARATVKDSLHFYNMALASLTELRYQYLICKDLDFLDEITYESIRKKCRHVGSLIYNWAQSQKANAGLIKKQ
ncbi:four helix bundle protein [Candidatus Falkowbacteria bacterium]|jgi:four helix bundle protein|nr:four helix bundle protein [Candidatus Falkowbacteria bacterium]MBT7007423.1 four helix bundle protein [Candidatus Falkowbacteria bacterium]